jgi:hypothetical protein
MKKIFALGVSLTFLMGSAWAKTANIVKITKSKNKKNVLYYQINYDEKDCTFTSKVSANWYMGEKKKPYWKPLSKSMGMIKKPLMPKSSSKKDTSIKFTTKAITGLAKDGIIADKDVLVSISKAPGGGCEVSNEIVIEGKTLKVSEIYSKVGIFSVKWIKIRGTTRSGEKFDKKYKQ